MTLSARRLAFHPFSRTGLLAACACAALLPLPAAAQMPAALGCLIEPSQTVELGAPVTGVVSRMLVERGDDVRKGQVLVQLAAPVERAGYSAAKQRSRAQAELASAESAEAFAATKLSRTRELHGQAFVAAAAVDQAVAEHAMAVARTRQVREQLDLAAQELAVAGAQLGQRAIRSPLDGVVLERHVSPGERVEDKPLLRLAVLDPLRVEVLMPAAAFLRIRPGMAATVLPELPGLTGQQAQVQLVDRTIDAASNSFRVRLLLPNPDHALPGGLRCKISFSAAASSAPPAPVPPTVPVTPPAAARPAAPATIGPGVMPAALPSPAAVVTARRP